MATEGLVTLESRYSAVDTLERLAAEIGKRGLTIFARIDHAAGAQSAGMSLRPTEVLLFGSPAAGTPLMQADQTIGIDLPLKLLVWEGADGKARVTYNDPLWLGARHGLPESATDRLEAMAAGLQAIAVAAAVG